MRELKAMPAGDVAAAAARAEERFRARAAEAGLLDVAYSSGPSPIGDLLVAATRKGLVRGSFPPERPADVVEELAIMLSPRGLGAPERLRHGPPRARRVLAGPPPHL